MLFAQDEIEPNNSFRKANLIDFEKILYWKIAPKSDDDYYKINIKEPGMIKLEILIRRNK